MDYYTKLGIYICIYVCIHIHMCLCMYIYICVYVYICMYMGACWYMYVYILNIYQCIISYSWIKSIVVSVR